MAAELKQIKATGASEGQVAVVNAAGFLEPGGFTGVNSEAVCKGWVNFDGTGTIAINDSFNVSSLTDNGTGDYDVNWDIDFDNADYSAVGSSSKAETDFFNPETGKIRVQVSNSSGTLVDTGYVAVQAFGDNQVSVGGSAPGVKVDSLCKGWINLDGTGTITIIDSFNVTSIVDNGTGDYTINWDVDFDNADYSSNVNSNQLNALLGTQLAASLIVFTKDGSFSPIDSDLVCVQAFGDNPIALSTEVSLLTRWTDVTTFTATPSSTSVLLMSDTSAMKVGVPIRYSDSSGTFYAQVTAISANVSITIRGAPFDTGDDVITLAVGLPEMMLWVIIDVAGNYADAADTDLNDGNDGKKMFWEGPRAYCMGFDMLHSLADTGAAQPRANLRLGGESVSVSSTGSSAGPLLSTAQTVVSTVVDINTANYQIDRGDKITCTTDGLGSNDNAEGLEMHAVFVME